MGSQEPLDIPPLYIPVHALGLPGDVVDVTKALAVVPADAPDHVILISHRIHAATHRCHGGQADTLQHRALQSPTLLQPFSP